MAKNSNDFSMETIEKIGVISDNGKNTLELRRTKVKDSEKFDLRTWYVTDDGEEKCNKGIRLTEEELFKLGELINSMGDFD